MLRYTEDVIEKETVQPCGSQKKKNGGKIILIVERKARKEEQVRSVEREEEGQ